MHLVEKAYVSTNAAQYRDELSEVNKKTTTFGYLKRHEKKIHNSKMHEKFLAGVLKSHTQA